METFGYNSEGMIRLVRRLFKNFWNSHMVWEKPVSKIFSTLD